MRLNKSQLKLFELIIQNNQIKARDVTFITKSLASTYLNRLARMGFLKREGHYYKISQNEFARTLANLLVDDSSLADVLRNESISILIALTNIENVTIDDIAKEVGLTKAAIYPYLRLLAGRQIVTKQAGKLRFNTQLWGNLYKFVNLYKKFYARSVFQVPNSAKIYYETPYEIVFSLSHEFKDAKKTAFSTYSSYGINLSEKEFFYRLDEWPEDPNTNTIMLDSLRIAGSAMDVSSRRRLYSVLFYIKNIDKLKKIRHPDLDVIKRIIDNKEKYAEENFPSWQEIKERCDDYDIRI